MPPISILSPIHLMPSLRGCYAAVAVGCGRTVSVRFVLGSGHLEPGTLGGLAAGFRGTADIGVALQRAGI